MPHAPSVLLLACLATLPALLAIGCGGGKPAGEPTPGPQGWLLPELRTKLDATVRAAFKEIRRSRRDRRRADAAGSVDHDHRRGLLAAHEGPDEARHAPAHRVEMNQERSVGTLLMQLVGEGKLSLDDKVAKYVKGVPNGERITMRQVATMTSGLASYTLDEQFAKQLFANPEPEVHAAGAACDRVQGIALSSAPERGSSTRTPTPCWSGVVIEKVTGKPIRRRPARADHPASAARPDVMARVFDRAPGTPARRATRCRDSLPGKPAGAKNWRPSWAWAAGAMLSPRSTTCSSTAAPWQPGRGC